MGTISHCPICTATFNTFITLAEAGGMHSFAVDVEVAYSCGVINVCVYVISSPFLAEAPGMSWKLK